MANVFTLEDMISLFKNNEVTMKVDSLLSFREGVKRRIPSIIFDYNGKEEFYNSHDNSITFGIPGIYEIFSPTSKAEAFLAYTFVSGHEEQHFRSTAAYPYERGYYSIIREIVSYAYEKATGKKKIFRGDNDVFATANELGEKHGVYLNQQVVSEFAGSILNMVEDGRIERIRSHKSSEFRDLREVWRWKGWNKNNVYKISAKHSPGEVLTVVINQLLSLSTTYRYEKGFYTLYRDDAEIMSYVDRMMPHIKKGIMSPGTRGMAEESIEIGKILAPLIYEAALIPEDIKKLMDALNLFFKKFENTQSQASGNKAGELKEDAEEQDGEADSSSISSSDLFEEDKETGKGGKNFSVGSGDTYRDGTVEEIMAKAMAAANAFIHSAEATTAKANNTASKKNKNAAKKKPEKPVDSKEMGKLAKCNFTECKRQYNVDRKLPEIIRRQGATLHRQNEKFFRSLSSPTVRFLDKGSIDSSRIYGLCCGNYDFYKRNGKPVGADVCAYILLDNSGSMGGKNSKKRMNSSLAAAIVEEGFKGLMPLKICAFDSSGKIRHQLIKDWNEDFNCNCAYNFLLQGQFGRSNEDDKDIIIATKELLNRSERNKLLVYMSDGAPSNLNATRQAVMAARSKGIKVVGLYFDSYNLEGKDFKFIMSDKNAIVCRPDEITNNLVATFKEFSRGIL